MELRREEVLHIATLCRVGMSDADVERFRAELSHILEQFQILERIDVAAVPPTGHPGALHTVMREDQVEPSYDQQDVLANAPQREDDFIRVRAVLEG